MLMVVINSYQCLNKMGLSISAFNLPNTLLLELSPKAGQHMSYLLKSSSLEAELDTGILFSVIYSAGARGTLWAKKERKARKGRENETLSNPFPQHRSATEVVPPEARKLAFCALCPLVLGQMCPWEGSHSEKRHSCECFHQHTADACKGSKGIWEGHQSVHYSSCYTPFYRYAL